jgi:hypothetical protein
MPTTVYLRNLLPQFDVYNLQHPFIVDSHSDYTAPQGMFVNGRPYYFLLSNITANAPNLVSQQRSFGPLVNEEANEIASFWFIPAARCREPFTVFGYNAVLDLPPADRMYGPKSPITPFLAWYETKNGNGSGHQLAVPYGSPYFSGATSIQGSESDGHRTQIAGADSFQYWLNLAIPLWGGPVSDGPICKAALPISPAATSGWYLAVYGRISAPPTNCERQVDALEKICSEGGCLTAIQKAVFENYLYAGRATSTLSLSAYGLGLEYLDEINTMSASD